MSPRRHHLILPTLLTTAGLAVAGCGGGSGGDEATYVKTYQGACTKITAATRDFQSSITKAASSAGSDPTKIIPAVKSGASKLFTTFGDQLKVLADADAPKQFADFQKSIKDAAGKATTSIDATTKKLADVKTLQDFSALSGDFQKIDLGDAKLPTELGKKAPACTSIGGGTTTTTG